jgi:RHS repeat-associated protein
MRTGNNVPLSTLTYLFGDHLGSTSLTYKADTGATTTTLYKPWGEVRYQSDTLPTDYTYTGQYSYQDDFGLMFYNARWYDSTLARMAQADTMVPGAGNPMAWDRYAGMMNNPLRYSDPSGHVSCETTGEDCDEYGNYENEPDSIKYNAIVSGVSNIFLLRESILKSALKVKDLSAPGLLGFILEETVDEGLERLGDFVEMLGRGGKYVLSNGIEAFRESLEQDLSNLSDWIGTQNEAGDTKFSLMVVPDGIYSGIGVCGLSTGSCSKVEISSIALEPVISFIDENYGGSKFPNDPRNDPWISFPRSLNISSSAAIYLPVIYR